MISIILPVRNEANYIRAALDAVLTQTYPQEEIEILIADGMSTDGTREIIKDYQKDYPQIQLLDNPGKIVPTGMNIALRQARGEIIIRVDGHCVIGPDYISNCAKHLETDGVDGVGGPMESIGETQLAKAIALAMSTSFGVGNSAFRTTKGQTKLVDTISFPAYTREIIQKAGMYDEELVRNQDDEYNYRIRELGGRLLLAGDVHSKYYGRGSFRKLSRQYFQYGYYKVRVLQKHPRQMSIRQFIPPVFVSGLVVSIILSLFTSWGWVSLLSITGVYSFVNLVASVISASTNGWTHLLLLPLTYAIIHISYGMGFLTGLLKFWNRWGDKQGLVPRQ